MNHKTIECPNCAAALLAPARDGIQVLCPVCGAEFFYEPDRMAPPAQSMPAADTGREEKNPDVSILLGLTAQEMQWGCQKPIVYEQWDGNRSVPRRELVTIQGGTCQDGTYLKLAGKGNLDENGNYGDLFIKICSVERGLNVYIDLPVTAQELRHGCTKMIEYDQWDGRRTQHREEPVELMAGYLRDGYSLRIPKAGHVSADGRQGDLYVRVQEMDS